jgi:hypothetical protein
MRPSGSRDEEIDPDRRAVEGVRAEIRRLRRLVGDAKARVTDHHLGDNSPVCISVAIDLLDPERARVKHCPPPPLAGPSKPA